MVFLRMDTFTFKFLGFPLRFWFTLSNGGKSPFLRVYTVFFFNQEQRYVPKIHRGKWKFCPPFGDSTPLLANPVPFREVSGGRMAKRSSIWFYLRSIQNHPPIFETVAACWYSMLLQGGPPVIDGVITPISL